MINDSDIPAVVGPLFKPVSLRLSQANFDQQFSGIYVLVYTYIYIVIYHIINICIYIYIYIIYDLYDV